MIGAFISLLIYIIVLAVLYWLAMFVLDNFPLPEPANRMVRVAITVLVVLAALYILLGVLGVGEVSVPRMRWG